MAQTISKQKADLQKQIADFERDKKAFNKHRADLESDNLQLEARNKSLKSDVEASEVTLRDLKQQTDDQKEALKSVKDEELETERSLARVEGELDTAKQDLQYNRDQLALEQSSIDDQLNEYERQKKESIKKNILAANATLVSTKRELTEVKSELETARNNLAVITQTASDEKLEREKELADHEEKLGELKVQIETHEAVVEGLTKEVAALNYEKHNAQAALKKTKEEHQKFLDYEKSAREKLKLKDDELQTRAATIQETGQTVKSRRSYLPEL